MSLYIAIDSLKNYPDTVYPEPKKSLQVYTKWTAFPQISLGLVGMHNDYATTMLCPTPHIGHSYRSYSLGNKQMQQCLCLFLELFTKQSNLVIHSPFQCCSLVRTISCDNILRVEKPRFHNGKWSCLILDSFLRRWVLMEYLIDNKTKLKRYKGYF